MTDSDKTAREPNPPQPKVFLSLQAGRGIAALMVVFYHCEGILSVEKYWHWTRYYFYFGSSGVDFFFVLSGIVILYAHQKDIGQPRKLGDYTWKRFRRIYPIYWVVLFATMPFYLMVPSLGTGMQSRPSVIVSSIVLLPFAGIDTIVPVAWTLLHEVLFYLAFSLLLVRRRLGVVVFCLWMAVSAVALFLPANDSPLALCISPLHLLFGLGLIIPFAVRRISFNGMPLAIFGVISFIGCCIFQDLMRPPGSYLALIYGVFSAIAATGLMLLERANRLHIPKFLTFLGDASYSLYLIHYLALSVAAKVLYPTWRRHPVPMIVPFFLLLCAAMGAGIGLHLFVERPLLRRFPRQIRS